MSKNIFFTKFSELSGERYDPNTYHYERLNAIEKLKKSSLKLEKLKYITKLDKKIVTTNDKNLPYIGLTNIESNTGIYTKGEEKEAFSSAVQFDKGQVLFPKLRPYLNKVYFADFDGLCSTEFHIFDSNIIDNKYLSIFLQTNLVVAQTKHLMSGNTLPRLQTEDIENLLIPIPSSNIQNKIISKMEEAYKLKEQKEREAQNKLDSIDNYLLNALGIEVPSSDKESLEDRVFLRKFSGISGDRIDSEFYQTKYIHNDISLLKSKYDINSIGNITTFTASGATPKSGGNDYEKNGNIYFLRLTNFNDNLEVDLSKSLFIKENIHNNMLKRSKLKSGDILFGIAGSIGKIAIFDKNIKANTNQAIAILRFKDNINRLFIAYLLNSIILKQQIDRHQRPVAQPNLNIEELKSLKIPLPPFEIQNKIANHIQQLRDEAKALKDEAIQIYEDTKKEVEDMILGDEL